MVRQPENQQYDIDAFGNGRIVFKDKIPNGDGNNYVETECSGSHWRIKMLFASGKRANIELCINKDDPQKVAGRAHKLHDNTVALVKQGMTAEEIEKIITALERAE